MFHGGTCRTIKEGEITRSLMAPFDFGSSMACGKKLEEHMSAYFSYVALETKREGYAPIGLKATAKAVVFPVPHFSVGNWDGTAEKTFEDSPVVRRAIAPASASRMHGTKL